MIKPVTSLELSLKHHRMSQHLIYRSLTLFTCSVMFISCGEKPAKTSKAETENKVDPIEKSVAKNTPKLKFIEHRKDDTETDVQNSKQLKLEVTAEIYDAPALALGESYSSKKQLASNATKVAHLANTSYSGQSTKLEQENCLFETEPLIEKFGQTIDLNSKVKFYDLEMKFSTTMKFKAPFFYEMSMADNPERVFVIIITTAKK